MAETENVTSKRDALSTRLKEKYPDREFTDDESFYGQIYDDYDEYDKGISDRDAQIEQYKGRERELTDLFDKDPRSAEFIADMSRGEDPWALLIKRYGADYLKEILDDPEAMEQFAEDNKEYMERKAQSDRLEQEAQANLEESARTIEQLKTEGGYTTEQIDEALLKLREIFENAIVGKYTRESLEMALKALNYDTAVSDARRAGELDGRNGAISERMRPVRKGDGVPMLGGANNIGNEVPDRPRSLFDIAKGAK